MADQLKKYKSLYSSTTNSFSTGTGETITPNSIVGLPTDTEITLTFDRVDSAGTATPTKMERIIGTISGANFVTRTSPATGRGADGSTEQAHTSPVVEMVWNAKDWNDAVDWAVAEHTQAGLHKAITTSQITASNVVGCQVTSCNVTASAITGVSKFPKVSGQFDNGNSGSAITINWLNGDRQKVTVTASTTLSYSNAAIGQVLSLDINEASGGGFSITMPASTIWSGGTVGMFTTTSNAKNSVVVEYDASQYRTQIAAGF